MIALYASSSKSGILLLLVILIYFQIISGKIKRLIYISAVIFPLVIISGSLNGLLGYARDYNNFSEVANDRPGDTNLIMGRVMAAVLTPRMILDHPIAGIGLGNYSLQRNNPYYLQGLPFTEEWDLPGLGLIGYIAELGIPLLLILMWLMWSSIKIVRERQTSSLVVVLASYQFFACLLGVQITFFYPWMVTALALGYSLEKKIIN